MEKRTVNSLERSTKKGTREMKKWTIELELTLNDETRKENDSAVEKWIEERLGQDMDKHESIDQLEVYGTPLVKFKSPEITAIDRINADFNRAVACLFGMKE